MSNVFSVSECIHNAISRPCGCVQNVKLVCSGSQRNKIFLPVVLVHSSALIVFVRFDDCSESNSKQLTIGFRSVLNSLAEKLEISINSFILCGYSDADQEKNISASMCIFNIYNDRIKYYSNEEQFDELINSVVDETTYRHLLFDEQGVAHLTSNLEFISGSNGQVKKDLDGNYYIRKHNRWFLASDIDPDEMFQKTVFFGAFGAHKFLEQKKTVGLAYFFTCGFFGAGWLFDCISLILGIYRDKEGKYILPVSNRKACLLKLLGGFGITVAYIFAYIFIFKLFGNLFENVVNKSVSSNQGAILNQIDA